MHVALGNPVTSEIEVALMLGIEKEFRFERLLRLLRNLEKNQI